MLTQYPIEDKNERTYQPTTTYDHVGRERIGKMKVLIREFNQSLIMKGGQSEPSLLQQMQRRRE